VKKHYPKIIGVALALALFLFLVFVVPIFTPKVVYTTSRPAVSSVGSALGLKKEVGASHLPTPKPLKAVYMSSWVAGTRDFRSRLIKLIDETEINAIVIDIKDYSGKISFEVNDPKLAKFGSVEKRIDDLRPFLEELHRKNIYVIGRIAVFQDPYMVNKQPELAVKRASDGGVWKDRKGISWIDPGSKEYWDYIVLIGKESYAAGFDELNFDYIRFPSDGNMKDISYPSSGLRVKREVMREFFKHLHQAFKGSGALISADLFGMTMTNTDDLNIGQVLEDALPYFDYIAPMVYPSHYPPGYHGYKNPAAMPYEVIKYNMDTGVARTKVASTTPNKLRPWLQDFDLGATYTAAMVRAQIQATNDAGLSSWMLWDPSNKYTPAALNP
jgi:hypothetical protein